MTESPALCFIMVGLDGEQAYETLAALAAQEPVPECVRRVMWAGLHDALGDVEAGWTAVVRVGAQLDPLWTSRLAAHLSNASVGVVGGRVLRFEGAQTAARWMSRIHRVSWVGRRARLTERFNDSPDRPVVMPTLFVSWDNMVCRTAILREAVAVDPDALAGEYATLPCALARKLRLDVLFDSELRSVRSCAPLRPETERAESGPDAWRLEGRREMLRRVSTLRGPRLVASVLRDLVIGTRHSPGIALGVAFAWWPTRRARWLANVAGKWEGLGALRRAANRITL